MARYGKVSPEPFYFIAAGVGSLLPDIDHPKSVVGKALKPISMFISSIFGHRGITHSLIGVLIFWVGGYMALEHLFGASARGLHGWSAWFFALAVGYNLHLAGDLFTSTGIPLFWPVRKRVRSPLRFSTGGLGEWLFVLACGVWLVFLVTRTYL